MDIFNHCGAPFSNMVGIICCNAAALHVYWFLLLFLLLYNPCLESIERDSTLEPQLQSLMLL